MGSRRSGSHLSTIVFIVVVIVGLLVISVVYPFVIASFMSVSITVVPPPVTIITSPMVLPTGYPTPIATPLDTTTDPPMTAPPVIPNPTLPVQITISKWHDDSSNCYSENNDKWVLVTGVEISGGVPPYRFTFKQFGNTLPHGEVVVSPDEGAVKFDPPILVSKGEDVLVTIRSSTSDGEPGWDSGLFYKLHPTCDRH
jgi:hypothetical protein